MPERPERYREDDSGHCEQCGVEVYIYEYEDFPTAVGFCLGCKACNERGERQRVLKELAEFKPQG
jgi:hypothetical protein